MTTTELLSNSGVAEFDLVWAIQYRNMTFLYPRSHGAIHTCYDYKLEVIFWLCFQYISVLEKVSDYTTLQISKTYTM